MGNFVRLIYLLIVLINRAGGGGGDWMGYGGATVVAVEGEQDSQRNFCGGWNHVYSRHLWHLTGVLLACFYCIMIFTVCVSVSVINTSLISTVILFDNRSVRVNFYVSLLIPWDKGHLR